MTKPAIDPTARATNGWTVESVHALGTTTSIVIAGSILGIGRTLAYRLHREGLFPVPVIQLGRKLVVPVAPLLERLGARPFPDV